MLLSKLFALVVNSTQVVQIAAWYCVPFVGVTIGVFTIDHFVVLVPLAVIPWTAIPLYLAAQCLYGSTLIGLLVTRTIGFIWPIWVVGFFIRIASTVISMAVSSSATRWYSSCVSISTSTLRICSTVIRVCYGNVKICGYVLTSSSTAINMTIVIV